MFLSTPHYVQVDQGSENEDFINASKQNFQIQLGKTPAPHRALIRSTHFYSILPLYTIKPHLLPRLNLSIQPVTTNHYFRASEQKQTWHHASQPQPK